MYWSFFHYYHHDASCVTACLCSTDSTLLVPCREWVTNQIPEVGPRETEVALCQGRDAPIQHLPPLSHFSPTHPACNICHPIQEVPLQPLWVLLKGESLGPLQAGRGIPWWGSGGKPREGKARWGAPQRNPGWWLRWSVQGQKRWQERWWAVGHGNAAWANTLKIKGYPNFQKVNENGICLLGIQIFKSRYLKSLYKVRRGRVCSALS